MRASEQRMIESKMILPGVTSSSFKFQFSELTFAHRPTKVKNKIKIILLVEYLTWKCGVLGRSISKLPEINLDSDLLSLISGHRSVIHYLCTAQHVVSVTRDCSRLQWRLTTGEFWQATVFRRNLEFEPFWPYINRRFSSQIWHFNIQLVSNCHWPRFCFIVHLYS